MTAPGGAVRRDAWLARLARVEWTLVLLLAAAISLSITASEICFLAALALRLVRWSMGERPRLISPLLAWSFLGLLLAWLLSGLFAPEMIESVTRVHRLYLVLVLFLVSEHAAAATSARTMIWAYLIGASAGAIYNFNDWIHMLQRAGAEQRLAGLFSTAMTSGNLHATAFVGAAAVALAATGSLRLAAGSTGLLSGAALLGSFTRSAWLGAATGVAALVIIGRRWRVLAALTLALVLVVALIPSVRQRVAVAFDPEVGDRYAGAYTARGRVSLWLTGLELFSERPITGWGLADHSRLIREHRRADATFEAGHFHSNPVQVAVATGTLGLIAFGLFQGALLVLLWRRHRRSIWAWAALGVWFNFQISGLFDWSFGDAEVTYQFFWWMGLGLSGAGPGLVDRDQRS